MKANALLFSILVAVGAQVWADSGPGEGFEGARMHKAMEKLDLSESQHEQVDQLMESTRKDMKSLMMRRHKAMEAMEFGRDATWDAKKARKQADAYGAVAADMAYQRMEMSNRLRMILNDEQWQSLQSMRDEHRDSMREGMRENMGSHGEGKPQHPADRPH